MKYLFFLLLSFQVAAQGRDCVNCEQGSLVLPDPELPQWPLELVQIKNDNLKRNPKIDYCKRPGEMLDTIVLHHAETPPSRTPTEINKFHIDRGWYMSGYSYMVNSAYPGTTSPATSVTEGRPLELVGSHAGSEAFVPMTPAQKELWNAGKIVCGYDNGNFVVDPKQVRGDTIKANVTTLGVVVIGNYVQYSRQNPAGYPRNKPRYPTPQLQDTIARLSCQLQKKYPNIKTIRWHSYYNQTDCPGTIKQFIGDIAAIATRYGCEFNK